MKKVIFFDIDGTLIDVQRGVNEPSFYTKYAIRNLIEKGNIVIIATGRFKGNIYKSIKDLNPSGYICSNGAYVEYNGNIIYEAPISNDLLYDLMDFCKNNNCLFTSESSDIMFTPLLNDYVFEFLDKWLLPHEIITDKFEGRKYYKCNIDIKDEDTCKLYEKKYKDIFDSRPQTANITGNTYDVNLFGINKGNGVEELIKVLNIDRENTYCFCDGSNDIELAKACKYSFAMENGDDGLKAISYGIAKSVKDDGVYKKLVELKLIEPYND